MNLEERVTHSLRHSAAPHRAGEACPHGARPAGHVCLPLTFIWADFFFFFFFCHQYPELLVASYNNNEDAPHEPDGVALVWNMKYKKATPEYVFHCQVLKAPLLLSPTPLHISTGGPLHNEQEAPPIAPLSSSSSSLTPLTLLPSCTLWVHRTGIHLHHIYPQTHVSEAPEKSCGAGFEWNPSTAAGLSVWGSTGYHVHLNKGPVFRRASRESNTAPPLCPALL